MTVELSPELKRVLELRPTINPLDDYSNKLRGLPNITDDLKLHHLWEKVDLDFYLNFWGLTKGQKAGVTRILNNFGCIRVEEPEKVWLFEPTIGEIRSLTDEQLLGLPENIPNNRSIKVLRKLFGRYDEKGELVY